MEKPKPKSIAMLALGKAMPPPGDDDEDGLTLAMHDFLDAVEAKDAGGMAAAFRHAMDISSDAD